MNSYIKWVEWKMIEPAETMNMFRNLNEYDIVPCIEEDNTTMSDPEDKITVHAIPDEG